MTAGAAAAPAGYVSQADALGAAEGLVRRMLEGALHGHHFALTLAETDGGGGDVPASKGAWGGAPSSPISGKTVLKLREAEATVGRLRDDSTRVATENARLRDEQREISIERDSLFMANRQLDAELEGARKLAESANARSKELTEELQRAFEARESVEADLAELRATVKKQVVSAVEASQEAARRAFDADMRRDQMAQERELAALRAAVDAERAASEDARRRCEVAELEQAKLEREKAALLAERTASATRAAALAHATLHSPERSTR